MQLLAGKTVATLGLKVINNGSGLLYFYSGESAVNKPQLIIDSNTATGIIQNGDEDFKVFQINNTLRVLSKEVIHSLSIFAVNGSCIYKNNNFADNQWATDISRLPVGLYLLEATIGNKTVSQKFVKQ